MRRPARTLLYACALIGLSTIAFRGLGDRLLFNVNPTRMNCPGATSRVVGDGVQVWIARSPGATHRAPEAYVLVFPGSGVRAESIINPTTQCWDDHAVEIWAINYPGNGESAGPATIDSVPGKALAAFDAIAKEARGKPIILAANSFGTAVALHVAAQRPASALMLQNPVPLRRLILGRYGWWNLWVGAGVMVMQLPEELRAYHSAPNISAPACFLISEQDAIVPTDYQQMIVNAYAGEKQCITMPGFGHRIPADDPTLRAHWRDAIAWTWPLLKAAQFASNSGDDARPVARFTLSK